MGNGRVAIVGGGIAGLTAAHELVLRGFEVTVYEKKESQELARSLGGKAKTQFSQRGSSEFPGEHGFRFFPSFYRHVVETMKRIPLQLDQASAAFGPYDVPAGGTVAQRLKRSPQGGVARKGKKLTIVDRSRIDSFRDITTLLSVWTNGYKLPPLDLAHLAWRLVAYFFSCNARRDNVWQKQTLWEFLRADRLSRRSQKFLNDLPKVLAAMDAKEGNARSLLNTLFLWSQDFVKDREADRILSGPTTKSWVEPWVDYLSSRGVAFKSGSEATVTGFTLHEKRVLSAQTEAGVDVQADYFVCAVPLDVVHTICGPELRNESAALAALLDVPAHVALRNMVGVQFFLEEPRPLVKGLVNYMDSEFGLTSISELQYWGSDVYQPPAGCQEVFSVIATKLPMTAQNHIALSCDELADSVLRLLNVYRAPDGSRLIDKASIAHVHVDSDLEESPDGKELVNSARHLIHPPRFQGVRVSANVGLENFFIAGDHVRCNTDVATMEGANETGRRAVNALLECLGLGGPCELFDQLDLDEPRWLKEMKKLDERRYPGPQDDLLQDRVGGSDALRRNPFAGAVTDKQEDGVPRFDWAKAIRIEEELVKALKASHSRSGK